MDRIAIVNASPLIFLSRGRQTHILRHFDHRILVPEPVAEEIRRKDRPFFPLHMVTLKGKQSLMILQGGSVQLFTESLFAALRI